MTDGRNASLSRTAKRLFARIGVLPILLVMAVVIFSLASEHFLSARNLTNVARQSTYLVVVALGQMIALVTGGIDMSVGVTVALSSVICALVMAYLLPAMPDALFLVILLGVAAGFLGATLMGLINGIGVAYLGVSPFMMTLGLASVGFGVALYLTSGTPVRGMPDEFGAIFGFGVFLGIPVPIYAAVLIVGLLYVLMNRTTLGRYFYAIGGNPKAARLSGVNERSTLLAAYLLCSALTAISGLLLTARLATGEANIGASLPLESIAACVIGGISLSGGVGRVSGAVLGALFIGLVQNGMNLARIDSYLQMVVIGAILIFAVVADRLRQRLLAEFSL
ncbi:MAG: ABC transporter permease [Parvibaculaceae bacterium]